jgi:hypothetical protein
MKRDCQEQAASDSYTGSTSETGDHDFRSKRVRVKELSSLEKE